MVIYPGFTETSLYQPYLYSYPVYFWSKILCINKRGLTKLIISLNCSFVVYLDLDPATTGIFDGTFKLHSVGQRYDVGILISSFQVPNRYTCLHACALNLQCNSIHVTQQLSCDLSYIVLQCVDDLSSEAEGHTRFYIITWAGWLLSVCQWSRYHHMTQCSCSVHCPWDAMRDGQLW